MPPNPTKHIQTHRGDNVRIGPVSVITLIIVICMAVMGVLAVSTSAATKTISDRQAAATERMYLDERAGQEFVAGVDDVLAGLRGSGTSASRAAQAVENALDSICEGARDAADGRVDCTASVDGTAVTAEFVCEDARLLDITLTIRGDATYRIDEWKMASAQQETDSIGALWTGE